MSPVMAALWSVPPGIAAGAVVGLWIGARAARSAGRCDEADDLSAEDRDAIELEFAQHARAVAHQVSEYADFLAGGDVVLRERLRQLERHAQGVV